MNKIVFFGGGQMALGMLKGLIRDEVLPAENTVVCEKVAERRSFLEETLGVKTMEDAAPELTGADMAIIAVNPWQITSVTEMMKGKLEKETIVLSIASGSPIKLLEDELGSDKKIVRVLPNTMIEVKTGYSAVVPNDNITEADTEIINQFVSVLGQVMYIEEDMFQTFAAYSGPGPMWAFKFIEAMIDAGVNSGFTREDSRKMTLMNVKGAAEVLLATGEHPATRVDQMTSPGGLTIEGIKILEEQGFGGVIMDSVEAAVKKGNSV
ncbi:MAG: pyrroline-5-carboxylate reductase [Firmicutes bacterium]|nr:pyrroline-5-carboxylate reductase [Bacillota bacterium]